MVLNSLAEEKLQASLRCLARHGRFLEIGKYDLSNNTPLGEFYNPPKHITGTEVAATFNMSIQLA